MIAEVNSSPRAFEVDLTMKELNIQVFQDKISIMQLTRKLANDLIKQSDFAGTDVLDQGLIHRILQSICFRPRSVKLVAYHNDDKTAIGFIGLKENTDTHYLIEDVLVDPKYRNMGVATRLLNYAITLAKERGAGSVNLDVGRTNTNAINLYKKCGFKEIGRTFIGQGYPIGFNRFRVIKRTVIGHGFLTKLTLGKDSRLIELQTNTKKNRETLFRICQRCMDQGWINFFEIDATNLIKGSGRVWHPPFFRNILINDSFNSFAIIFNYPFSHKATVEVYSTSNTLIPTMLDNLMKTLANRGIPFAQITVFNPNNTVFNWFRDKRMLTFQLITMGKKL
jgi:ribosomal protein S18 acetylase RimI-like enzyme